MRVVATVAELVAETVVKEVKVAVTAGVAVLMVMVEEVMEGAVKVGALGELPAVVVVLEV